MRDLWLTSDQHYGHRNVIKYCDRPFRPWYEKLVKRVSDASIERMNEALIDNHNATVKPGDLVIHLGDFSLSKEMVHLVLPLLNGEHWLVMGNHDWCHPVRHKRVVRASPRFTRTLILGVSLSMKEWEFSR